MPHSCFEWEGCAQYEVCLFTKGQCTLQTCDPESSVEAQTSGLLRAAPIISPLDDIMLALRDSAGKGEAWGLGLRVLLLPSLQNEAGRALSEWTSRSRNHSGPMEKAYGACSCPSPSPTCLIFMTADYKTQIYHLSLQPSVP